MVLVSCELESPFDRALSPGARDYAVGRTDVVQLAIGDDVSSILCIRLEVDCPFRGIECDYFQGESILAGVDRTDEIASIQFQKNHQMVPLRRCRTPIPALGAGQRMALLSQCWHGYYHTCQKAKQTGGVKSHLPSCTVQSNISGQ